MDDHDLLLAGEVDEPCMKSRSTQAVVGLCGNDRTITRGLGHEYSQRRRIRSKKSPSSLTSVVIGTSRTSAPAKSGP